MQKNVALALREKADELAREFSNPERELSNGESFTVDKITPLSEYVAAITLRKSSGKYALVAAIYVKNFWFTFFPTDSHLLALKEFASLKQKIEVANYGFN